MNKYLNLIVFFFFIFTVCFLSLKPVHDYDIFYHLAMGRYILTYKRLPPIGTFVKEKWKFTKDRWVKQEWLSQVLFFITYKFFSFKGLIFLRMFILVIIFTLFFIYTFKITRCLLITLIGSVILLLFSKHRFYIRPELFTFLWFTVYLMIFNHLKERQEVNCKSYILVLIILGLWINLHGGFIIGLSLVLIFIWLQQKSFKIKLILSAITISICFLHPQHFHVLIYPFTYITRPILKSMIYEWQPPQFTFLFVIICALTLGVAFYFLKIKDYFRTVCIVLFGSMGWSSLRFLPLSILATLIFSLIIVKLYEEKIKEKWKILKDLKLSLIKHVILVTVVLYSGLLFISSFLGWLPYKKCFLVKENFPFELFKNKSLKFIFKKSFYHPFAYGGFFIFKNISPFIDGRMDIYNDNFLKSYRQLLMGKISPEKFALNYNLMYFIIPLDFKKFEAHKKLYYTLKLSSDFISLYKGKEIEIFKLNN